MVLDCRAETGRHLISPLPQVLTAHFAAVLWVRTVLLNVLQSAAAEADAVP